MEGGVLSENVRESGIKLFKGARAACRYSCNPGATRRIAKKKASSFPPGTEPGIVVVRSPGWIHLGTELWEKALC